MEWSKIAGIFGRRVAEERARQGLSMRQLEERDPTLHRSVLSRVEAGRSNARLVTVGRIAAALGVAPWTLLREEDER